MKKNTICIAMILAGAALSFFFENEGIDFSSGFLIGGGIALLFSKGFKSKITS